MAKLSFKNKNPEDHTPAKPFAITDKENQVIANISYQNANSQEELIALFDQGIKAAIKFKERFKDDTKDVYGRFFTWWIRQSLLAYKYKKDNSNN